MLQRAIELWPQKPGFLPQLRVVTAYFRAKTRFLATRAIAKKNFCHPLDTFVVYV